MRHIAIRGIAGERLRVVRSGSTFAAVGDVGDAPRLGVRAIRRHDAVVRWLARRADAVLPMRFGTVVSGPRALAELLQPRRRALAAALRLVRQGEQMTVRVFAGSHGPRRPAGGTMRLMPVASRVARRSTAFGPAREKAECARTRQPAGPGARYLMTRARADVQSRSAPEIDPLRPALAPLVRAERVQRHDDRGAEGAGRPSLAVSVYHLIARGQARAYLEALRQALRGASGLRIAASGPFPPYAFAPEELS